MGKDQEFIGIDMQDPLARTIFREQVIDPIHAKSRIFERAFGKKQRDVRLFGKLFLESVSRFVVENYEMLEPHSPVIAQKEWHALDFVIDEHNDDMLGVL